MKKRLLVDWWLLLPAVVLVILGLLTLISVNVSYFRAQLLFFIVSLVVFFFISQINLERLKFLALPIYISALIILFILLIIGFEARGAVRWIDVFGISLQPSEIHKPLLTISMATFLSSDTTRSKM